MLEDIAVQNAEVISTLSQIILTIKDELIQMEVAESLGKIDYGNPLAINTLLNITCTSENDYNRDSASSKLHLLVKECINVSKPEYRQSLINALIKLLEINDNPFQKLYLCETLGELEPNNLLVVDTLIDLLNTLPDRLYISKPLEALTKILPGNQQACKRVVSQAKDFLIQSYENINEGDNYERFEAWYEIFWCCAETLDYPEFFCTLHNQPANIHHQREFVLRKLFYLAVYPVAYFVVNLKFYLFNPFALITHLIFKTSKLVGFLIYRGLFLAFVLAFPLWLPIHIIFRLLNYLSKRFLGLKVVDTILTMIVTFVLVIIILGPITIVVLGAGLILFAIILCLLAIFITVAIPISLIIDVASRIFKWGKN